MCFVFRCPYVARCFVRRFIEGVLGCVIACYSGGLFFFVLYVSVGSLAPLDGALSPWGLVYFLLLSARL